MATTRNRKYRNCTHTEENRRLYWIWQKMKQRCCSPKCDRYKDYGGRGITICQEWLDNFDNFADWAYSNGYQNNLTLDRKDNDKGYSPENCHWATRKEQARNKRRTTFVEYKGINKPLTEWCEELGLSYTTMVDRIINRGWSVERAFEEKSQQENSFAKLCKEHNINYITARDRVNKLGWTIEQALNTPTKGRGASVADYGINTKKKCAVCGKEFERNNSKQIYCGYRCRTISARRSYRETGEITNYHGISKNPDYIEN